MKIFALCNGTLLTVALAMGARATESPPVSPEESLTRFSVDPGFAVELVAAEPLVRDPVAIDWGFDGKLWVAEMADYPYGIDGKGTPGGRVRFLEDTDGDGRMDTSTLFLEGLSFPTSVMAWDRGVLITAAPDLLYAEDTDGDGRADRREILFTGFMEGNQQLRLNGLRWGLDGWVYAASGGHHAGFGAKNRIRVGKHPQAAEVALGSGDLRFDPATGKLERLAGPSQFGRVRDDWGNWFGVQNSYPLWHYVLDEATLKRNPHVTTPDPRKQLRGQQPRVFGNKPSQKRFHGFDHVGRYTSACGPSIYRDNWLYPAEEDLTHAFTCEPFSNLVQHHHLTRSGASFEGARAPSTSETDFLASSDRWCRPVMTRTGPDGALWVVDMYRYMIEHPDWLPQNGRDELKSFFRHGEDRGRIYRVVPVGKEQKSVPRLNGLTPDILVTYLADSNGLVRDAAQRLLMAAVGSNASERLLEELKRLAAAHDSPRVRVQAMATAAAIGMEEASRREMVGRAFQDPDPWVRRQAIRLTASGEGEGEGEALASLTGLAGDPDPVVRLEAATKLGESTHVEAGRGLLAMAQQPEMGVYMEAAILGSVANHLEVFARAAGSLRAHEGLMRGLLSTVRGHPSLEEVLMANVFEWKAPSGLDYRLLAHWLDGAKSASVRRDSWEALIKHAQHDAGDPGSAETSRRIAAMGLLGRFQEDWLGDRENLVRHLEPQWPSEIQLAAMAGLHRAGREEVPERVLAQWTVLSPTLRRAAIDRWLATKVWRRTLLQALERGALLGSDLTGTQRQRLLKLERGAAQWLELPPGREEAMVARNGALALEGVVTAGKVVFEERCALCHQVGEMGKPIGPDLRALTNRSPEAIYAAILDPNRAVEPQYLAYTAITDSDAVVYGIVKGETGNTLTFVQLDGTERALLRKEVASLESSRTSLMPEGLEVGVDDQALADLIAFVQTIK